MMNRIIKQVAMKYKYIIFAETHNKLSTEVQMELLVEIRNAMRGVQNNNTGVKFSVIKEVGMNDIAEALGISTLNTDPIHADSQSIQDCKYYDEAQGRNKCCNDLLKSCHCKGVCKLWEYK